MKEFPFTFKEGFTRGLRRFDTNPINSQSLTELHNMAPDVGGLTPHQLVISLNATGVAWGGVGAKASAVILRDITISIKAYVDDSDIANASVYIDDVYVGVTDADGEINVSDVTVGGHALKVTATGYVDSDDDDLLNDYFVVA